jgi:hypothetical protein
MCRSRMTVCDRQPKTLNEGPHFRIPRKCKGSWKASIRLNVLRNRKKERQKRINTLDEGLFFMRRAIYAGIQLHTQIVGTGGFGHYYQLFPESATCWRARSMFYGNRRLLHDPASDSVRNRNIFRTVALLTCD